MAADKKTNWHKIADRLASRLMHNAPCDAHDELDEDCPFCADAAAYQAYLDVGGTVRAPSYEGVPTVGIQELVERP